MRWQNLLPIGVGEKGTKMANKIGIELAQTCLSPETGFLHSQSCMVKTSFGHIPSIEQSKRDLFITAILNIFTISIVLQPNVKLCTASIKYYSIVNFIHLLCSMC